MQKTSLEDALERVASSVQAPQLRELKPELGQTIIRQGDVYLVLLNTSEKPKMGVKLDTLQLAPGITKGSRHIVDGAVLMEHPGADEMTGPYVLAEKAFVVTHPEHADVQCPPGRFKTGYQTDMRTKRRVQD